LQRDIQRYDYEEKSLIKLFRHSEINEEFVLAEIRRIKADRKQDKEELSQLGRLQDQKLEVVSAKECLSEFCEIVRQSLNNCSLEDKRLALDALGIKVFATQDKIEIKLLFL
jgi:hypothetical protein